MAKKEEPKKVLERVYNVPLRKEFQKAASWRRTEKAVTALRKFISRHMKSDNIIIEKYANKELWKNGIKNPPHHIKVNAIKDDKGKVTVELAELPAKAKRELDKEIKLKKKKEEKEEAKKAEEAKKKEAEKKPEETKEEKAKKEEKEELKEIKKELPKQAPKPMAAPKQVEQRPTAPKGQ